MSRGVKAWRGWDESVANLGWEHGASAGLEPRRSMACTHIRKREQDHVSLQWHEAVEAAVKARWTRRHQPVVDEFVLWVRPVALHRLERLQQPATRRAVGAAVGVFWLRALAPRMLLLPLLAAATHGVGCTERHHRHRFVIVELVTQPIDVSKHARASIAHLAWQERRRPVERMSVDGNVVLHACSSACVQMITLVCSKTRNDASTGGITMPCVQQTAASAHARGAAMAFPVHTLPRLPAPVARIPNLTVTLVGLPWTYRRADTRTPCTTGVRRRSA